MALKVVSGNFRDVGRLQAFRTLGDLKFNPLALLQGAKTLAVDRGVVHEHILAIVLGDKAVPFLTIEPFHCTLDHTQFPSYLNDVSAVLGESRQTRPSAFRSLAGAPTAGCLHREPLRRCSTICFPNATVGADLHVQLGHDVANPAGKLPLPMPAAMRAGWSPREWSAADIAEGRSGTRKLYGGKRGW